MKFESAYCPRPYVSQQSCHSRSAARVANSLQYQNCFSGPAPWEPAPLSLPCIERSASLVSSHCRMKPYFLGCDLNMPCPAQLRRSEMNTRTVAGDGVGFLARIARFMERTSRRGVGFTNRCVRLALFQIIPHLAPGSLAFGRRLVCRYAGTMTGVAVRCCR